jgi:hypothetical protein
MKNYIGFVNDHSGSMNSLRFAAIKDYNANITAVKDAASREMLDTVVSVVGLGVGYAPLRGQGYGCTRQVQVSNPHVLKPITDWSTQGGTPLYDGIGNMIELLSSLPDANDPNVSMLVMVTTDGEEAHSSVYTEASLKQLIAKVNATGRWTFVFRLPKTGAVSTIKALGIHEGNIQFWDTTEAGMEASTRVNTQAMNTYFTARSAGAKSSSSFYTDASKVDITALKDISKDVSLYVVPHDQHGIEIRPFILEHRMEYLKGAAFYQLTKTESKVSHTKQVLVRDRASGKIFAGAQARKMIGLPSDRNARLHPGDHKNFDLFIQSESVNRKLVGGTGVVYWKEIGVPFTEADLAYLQPKAPGAAPVAPPVLTLPQVPVSNRPTKSPIPVTPQFQFFDTREDARIFAGAHGIKQSDILRNPTAVKGRQWSVPTKLVKQAATA